MRRSLFLTITSLLTVGCTCASFLATPTPVSTPTPAPTATPTPPPTPEDRRDMDEYAVYSALIRAMYLQPGIDRIVIDDHTSPGLSYDPGEDLDYVTNRLPGLEEETLADFQAQNRESHPLTDDFDLSVEVVLIGEEELDQIFGDMEGWDTFYATYPDSQGRMTLSRVGFNRQGTQALVYVGNQSHWLAGTGHLVLLAGENGVWTLQGEVTLWIS